MAVFGTGMLIALWRDCQNPGRIFGFPSWNRTASEI
jgi:hypothetical protein